MLVPESDKKGLRYIDIDANTIIISKCTTCYRNIYDSTNYVQIIYDLNINTRFSKFIRPIVRNGKG